jgi:hypothetical protein
MFDSSKGICTTDSLEKILNLQFGELFSQVAYVKLDMRIVMNEIDLYWRNSRKKCRRPHCIALK